MAGDDNHVDNEAALWGTSLKISAPKSAFAVRSAATAFFNEIVFGIEPRSEARIQLMPSKIGHRGRLPVEEFVVPCKYSSRVETLILPVPGLPPPFSTATAETTAAALVFTQVTICAAVCAAMGKNVILFIPNWDTGVVTAEATPVGTLTVNVVAVT